MKQPYSGSTSPAFELPQERLLALVDCNNFFVSCERVFDPSLLGRPVVVLSNNDGCIISRSNEAKALGIPMGAPVFQWEVFIKQHRVRVCSANFTLYSDLSCRIAETLRLFSPEIENYSVDESFLAFDRLLVTDLPAYVKRMKDTLLQWVGIPVTIGIGTTKTLAKLANDIAKKRPEMEGVLNMIDYPAWDSLLASLDVEEVWGIGGQLSKHLKKFGYNTVFDLRKAPDRWIRERFGITVLKTVWELRGISCLPIKQVAPPKKGITVSRSFGQRVTTLAELQEAVAFFVSRGAEKLRSEGSAASIVSVFFSYKTSDSDRGYSHPHSNTVQIPVATNYTPTLIHYALQALTQIYRPHERYNKAGIIFGGIVPEGEEQMALGTNEDDHKKAMVLMKTMDEINHRWGARAAHSASTGYVQRWQSKHNMLSKHYTTAWDELLLVH